MKNNKSTTICIINIKYNTL